MANDVDAKLANDSSEVAVQPVAPGAATQTPAVLEKFSKKFLFVTDEALSVDLAWKLKEEGNEVKMYVGNEEDQDVGDGFVEKVDDWLSQVDWADVIVFDDVISGPNGFGKVADELRGQGKLVIGGSQYTDRLETDREFGQQEMKSAGMLVLPHWDFDSFGEAIEFLKQNPGRYIFKPSEGDLDWHVKNLLFIAQEEDGKDLLEVLEHNRKSWARKIKRFQFQKVATGAEIAVGAFFNGHDFISPINVSRRHRPGDARNGNLDVLGRTERFFCGDARQDARKAAREQVCRLHRHQLHREREGHLSTGVHVTLRLSHDQHSHGRHPESHGRILVRDRERGTVCLENAEGLSGWRGDCDAAVSVS